MKRLIEINGPSRRIGEGEVDGCSIKIFKDFQEHQHLFQDSMLSVFFAIVWCADAQTGWCFPSIGHLAQVTGKGKDTVIESLNRLVNVKIEEVPILLRLKTPPKEGKFQPNRYLIFPSLEDIEKYKDDAAPPEIAEILGFKEIVKGKIVKEPKEKPIKFEKETLIVPRRKPGTGLRDVYNNLLTLFEEAKKTKKQLVLADGKNADEVVILQYAIKELFNEMWIPEYSFLKKYVNQFGYWTVLNMLFKAFGNGVKGDPMPMLVTLLNALPKTQATRNAFKQNTQANPYTILDEGENIEDRVTFLEKRLSKSAKIEEHTTEQLDEIAKIKEAIEILKVKKG